MSFYKYSVEYAGENSGRAQVYDLNASYKDLSQVAAAIRRLPAAKARSVLEDCIAMRRPIEFRKFAKGTGHRSQLGGKRGKFPKKECRLMLLLLDNALANAKAKGLDEKSLVVLHASAYKQNVFPRYRKFFAGSTILGYGKQAIYSSYVTARAEVVVGEKHSKKLRLRRNQPPPAKTAKTNASKPQNEAKPAPKKEQEKEAKPETKKESKQEANKDEKEAEKKPAEKPAAAKQIDANEKKKEEPEQELTAERLFKKTE